VKRFLRETKFVLCFLIVLTASTILSLSDSEVEAAPVTPAELIKIDSPVVSAVSKSRAPASIAETKNEILNVRVNCDEDKKSQQNALQSFVMLNLNLCHEIKNTGVSLTNMTNGFKAQLFKLNTKNYRTDFIQLSKGTNILVIESVLKDGHKKVQTLEIVSGS
jgi:hypothetical protein